MKVQSTNEFRNAWTLIYTDKDTSTSPTPPPFPLGKKKSQLPILNVSLSVTCKHMRITYYIISHIHVLYIFHHQKYITASLPNNTLYHHMYIRGMFLYITEYEKKRCQVPLYVTHSICLFLV